MIACTSTAQTIARGMSEALADPLVDLQGDGTAATGNGDPVDDDERVIVVGSTTTSQAHMDLLELQERAQRRAPSEVITVIPYLGYARQDKKFNDGEPISARAVARAIGASTDRVLVVNPHTETVLDHFGVPAEPIDAAPQLAASLPADLTDPVFLGPDADAGPLAASVRDAYGTGEVDNFEKVRHSATDVEVSADRTDFSGRDVVLVDDMIATGGTMSEAVRALESQAAGPARVFVTCIHPLLVKDALIRLYRAGVVSLYATDSIDRSIGRVSAAPPIVDALRR